MANLQVHEEAMAAMLWIRLVAVHAPSMPVGNESGDSVFGSTIQYPETQAHVVHEAKKLGALLATPGDLADLARRLKNRANNDLEVLSVAFWDSGFEEQFSDTSDPMYEADRLQIAYALESCPNWQ
jgi:hypothetical protein